MSFFDFLSTKELKSELEKTKNELNEKTAELKLVTEKLETTTAELETTTFRMNQWHSNWEKSQNELNTKKTELFNALKELRKFDEIVSKSNSIAKDLSESLSVTTKDLGTLEASYNDLMVQHISQQENFEFVSKKHENLSNEHDFISNKYKNVQSDYDNLVLKYTSLKVTLESVSKKYNAICNDLKNRQQYLEDFLKSNVSSFPFLAGVIADYITYDMEILAKKLDWGHSVERAKKVASIREIRADARQRIEEAKVASYQLEYLKALFPSIDEILETDFSDLQISSSSLNQDYDRTRDYLSKEEWSSLSESERNQLALDRYIESRKKSKWQIGRDYELFVGYKYSLNGFHVDFFGSYMGLEDLGRDLIATKDGKTLLIQCKYWSQRKNIHEKHIAQLYGTAVCYSLENHIPMDTITPILITNITLSDMAKSFCDFLSVKYKENFEMGDFPRIKCNIGKSDDGPTKIYHLPMDQQYDTVKIDKKEEFFAFTVKEAEEKGFRRAYRWHG